MEPHGSILVGVGAEFFLMPLSSRKIPLFVGLPRYFPIGPMHRHLGEITAIFRAREQG